MLGQRLVQDAPAIGVDEVRREVFDAIVLLAGALARGPPADSSRGPGLQRAGVSASIGRRRKPTPPRSRRRWRSAHDPNDDTAEICSRAQASRERRLAEAGRRETGKRDRRPRPALQRCLPDQLDNKSRLWREDAGGVAGPYDPTRPIECHEADAPLDDQRVPVAGNHVAESHSPDRVEREPRFHADVDVDASSDAPARNGRRDDLLKAGSAPSTPATTA